MNWILPGLMVLVLLFGFVVAFGAPYLPTLTPQTDEALDMLGLKPGQTLLELGCGDGRVVKAAAKKGLNVVGYELNPVLVIIARLNNLKYRRQVKIIWGNYWRQTWPDCDAIFVFLLDKYMLKLDKRLILISQQQSRPIKLLSFTFKVPGRKPSLQRGGLFLYKYH